MIFNNQHGALAATDEFAPANYVEPENQKANSSRKLISGRQDHVKKKHTTIDRETHIGFRAHAHG